MKQHNRIKHLLLAFVFLVISSSMLVAQNNVDSIVELGNDLANLEDYKQADKTFDRALDIKENYKPALEGKIQVLLMMDKFSKAEKIAEDAIDQYPQDPTFHMYMGKVLIERGNFEDALSYLSQTLAIADDSDSMLLNKVYVNMGAAYQKIGQTGKAMENYTQALSLNRNNPNVFIYRGNLYYKQQSYTQALNDFQRVLALDPNNHVAQYNVGMCFFKQGEKRNACDAFHKACELGNTNACKMVISKCLRSSETQ